MKDIIKNISNIILQNNRKLNVALDVNTGEGEWIEIMSDYFNSVIGFEPFNFNFKTISDKIKGKNNVKIKPWTLGNANDIHIVFYNKETKKYKITYNDDDRLKTPYRIDIKTIEVQKWIQDVDFIRLDTSGYEIETLKGGINVIKRDKPFLYFNNMNNDLLEYLNNINYKQIENNLFYI